MTKVVFGGACVFAVAFLMRFLIALSKEMRGPRSARASAVSWELGQVR